MAAQDAGTPSPPNSARAEGSPVATIVHAPLPLHAPVQRSNRDAPLAVSRSATVDPPGTVITQDPGQSIPAGSETTRPEPGPARATLTRAVAGIGRKMANTCE